jgi:Ca2+-binding RTX toxin-like protein
MPNPTTGGVVAVLSAGVTNDVAISADGTHIYAAGSDGNLRVYDANTGQLQATWHVGTQLGGIDVSPDGSFLMATELTPLGGTYGNDWTNDQTQTTTYKVDLSTGAVTSYPVTVTADEYVFNDVAVLSDGTVLLSEQELPGWSGWVPAWTLDLSTGTYTKFSSGRMGDFVSVSDDGTHALFGQADISDASLSAWQTGSGFIGNENNYANGVEGFNTGAQAISSEAGLIAQYVPGNGLHIYNLSLQYQQNLATHLPQFMTDGVAGLAFDSSGQNLFVLDATTDSIVQVSTTTWNVVQTIAVGADVATDGSQFADSLLVSPDSHYFTILTGKSVLEVGNPAVSDIINGTSGDDHLTGTMFADIINGLDGNDTLNGNGGADTLVGGTGNDTYIVTDPGTTVVENANEGTDQVYSSVDFTLPDNVENLTLLGSASLNGTGNSGDNHIVGNSGDNVLIGGAGHDTLEGGDGNDTLMGGIGDDYLDGGTGNNTASYADAAMTQGVNVDLTISGPQDTGGSGTDTLLNIQNLQGSAFADHLTGDANANILNGGAGDDTLTGGGGTDSMDGGAGNDTYVIASTADHTAAEIHDSGSASDTDTVLFTATASGSTLTLYAGDTGIEQVYIGQPGNSDTTALNVDASATLNALTITGNAGANSISGSNWDDHIDGGDGSDTLVGNAGNDWLSGGDGNDRLQGGIGNDTLDGGTGADTMTGGLGDDHYYVDNVGDTVRENAGEGTDTVDSTISYTLGANVENLTLDGSTAIDGTGNTLDNVIAGNDAANVLQGLAGNDTINGNGGNDTISGGDGNDVLIGGAGVDTLSGGAGNDIFRDTAAGLNGDTITDFSAGDKIVITDVDPGSFTYSLSGNVLTYSGGSVTLSNITAGVQAHAAAGGGVELTLLPAVSPAVGHAGDFNGDGISDILWRSDSGQLTDWLGTGDGGYTPNAANALQSVSNDWQIVGIGDFNGDGRDDIMWRSSDGHITNWLGTGSGGFTDNAANAYNAVSTDWQVVGIGDFNGDHRDDILWRNSDGRITDWLSTASGGYVPNGGTFLKTVSTDWQVAAVGDFNGDGISDILWRNSSGSITDWLGTANGSFTDNASHALNSVSTDWQIAGVGDINGDGISDIIWRNVDGRVTDWLGTSSGGFTPNAANFYTSLGTDWQVASIGDFNGDGHDDIEWRSTDGRITNWLGTSNGSFTDNAANALTGVDNHWHVMPQVDGMF